MSMDKSQYPTDWPAISKAIRERAEQQCEWCGAVNGAVGARDRDGEWWNEDEIHGMNSDHGYELFGDFPAMIRIVLTVAHLGTPYADGRPGNKHNKADCRPENLAALCQRCHLNYDRADHLAHAAVTRARKRAERAADLGPLFASLQGAR